MTLLAVSISGSSIHEIRSDIESAIDLGADLIELRLDLMPGVSDDEIRSLHEPNRVPAPLILTIRSVEEGGQWQGEESARLNRLIELSPIAEYVDFEMNAWRASESTRRELTAALRPSEGQIDPDTSVAAPPRKLILSRHDHRSRPPTLHSDLLAMCDETLCDVPKLAWRARTVRDNFEAFELMRDNPRRAIVICMGEPGTISRVLARKFGAFATFASASRDRATAPGQLSVQDLATIYRWQSIDHKTTVYGVVGDPVTHSLGPVVHNAAFAKAERNSVYVPLPVGPSYEAFKAFMVEWLARPWLDLRGVSVTAPHKENALRYLSEHGGQIDALANRVGSINTLTVDGDTMAGRNTDHDAILAAVRDELGWTRADWNGRTVAVLGAGGVGRAVVAALAATGARVTIFNRTLEKAESLARDFDCQNAPWEDCTTFEADLVVNCTTLGLWPNVDESPIPEQCLKRFGAVFDTIYNPLKTRLLRDAAAHGCQVVNGLAMFLRQAEDQFRGWTGRAHMLETMHQAARTALGQSNV